MIKSVSCNREAQTLAECFNPITIELTDAFFSPSHPFGQMLREKVYKSRKAD